MRKGQAAMEFLMTYGWAILVVLAAIGALAYFGILSPSKFLPSSCTITGGFSCTEYKITNGTVTMGIQNNLGVAAKDISVTLNSTSCNVAATGSPFADSGASEPVVENGAKIDGTNIVFSCATGGVGAKFKGDIKIVYTKGDESLSHTATGTIQASVEE